MLCCCQVEQLEQRVARKTQSSSSSSSLGSHCVPWLGEGLSMSSPNYPVLCCPLPYRVAPVFLQVVSPPLGWSLLSSFLVIWSPSGDARGPSVVFEAVDMPCPGPFHFSHSVDYIYEFCPLPNPDVGPSIFVCESENTIPPIKRTNCLIDFVVASFMGNSTQINRFSKCNTSYKNPTMLV